MEATLANLDQELQALKLIVDPRDLNLEAITTGRLQLRTLEHIELFARRAKEVLAQLEAAGKIQKQKRMSDPLTNEGAGQSNVLSINATVLFSSIGGRSIEGKVDTGATTSSLDASDITINKERGTVSFKSKTLSDNIITMDLDGTQQVASADGDGDARPMVKFDIEVNGTPLHGIVFNLNDRDHMDLPLLIGQNIIKAGKFSVDINQGGDSSQVREGDETVIILQAIQTLTEHNISLGDIIKHLRTEAVNSIRE